MEEFKIKEVPLTRSYWKRLAEDRTFNIDTYLKENYPDYIVKQVRWLNGTIYAEGAISIVYKQKSESQLYRERFDYLLNSLPIEKPKKIIKFGHCEECNRYVFGWKPVFGGLAPEWWATMREHGIDPATGHKQSCSRKSIKY